MTAEDARHGECAAYGCPMTGCRTHSTAGSKEWYCHIHIGADAGNWQSITAELKRLVWIVEATRLIRLHHNKRSMDDHRANIYRDINLAQRSDLQQQESESTAQWGIRLEDVLATSCAAMIANENMKGMP